MPHDLSTTRPRHARRSTRRGSQLMMAVGIALIVGAVGIIGHLGWQYWGTNIVSRHQQGQALEELDRQWSVGKETASTTFGDANAVIKIPTFGKDYAVPAYDGTSDRALGAGFGTFDSSAAPGEAGNYSLAAHRITHGEPLRKMPELKVGDEVHVVTRTTTYIYKLTSSGRDLTVPFTAGWVLDPLPKNPAGGTQPAQKPGQALITLTTCSELFHTDDRLIAFGVLDRTVPTR